MPHPARPFHALPALLACAAAAPGTAQPLALAPAAAELTVGAEPLRFRVEGAPDLDRAALLWSLAGPGGAGLARDRDGAGATFPVPFVLEPTEYRVAVADPRDPARKGEAVVMVHPHPLFRRGSDLGGILEAYAPHWRLPRLEAFDGACGAARGPADGARDRAGFDFLTALAWVPRSPGAGHPGHWLAADQRSLHALRDDGVATRLGATPGAAWVWSMAVDPGGPGAAPATLYLVTSAGTDRILAVPADGPALGYAGAEPGCRDGDRRQARFHTVGALVVDGTGALWVADRWNGLIRRIDRDSGQVTTEAGIFTPREPSHPALVAGCKGAYESLNAMALDARTGDLLVADDRRLCRVTPGGAICTLGLADPDTEPGGAPAARFAVGSLAIHGDWLLLTDQARGLLRIHLRTLDLQVLVPADPGAGHVTGPLPGTPGVDPRACAALPGHGWQVVCAPTGQCLVFNHCRILQVFLPIDE